MKKVLKGAVLAIVLSLIVSCLAIRPQANEDYQITEREWAFVCNTLRAEGYKAVDCHKLEKPIVVVSDIVNDLKGPALHGLTYQDEQYVFVNAEAELKLQRMIVVHETTHYVLWATYGELVDDCTNEHMARIVHHKWAQLPYDDSWRKNYGCKE